MMIRFLCPHCGRPLKAPMKRAGHTVICPRCDNSAVVPASHPADDEDPEALATAQGSYPEGSGGLTLDGPTGFAGMSSRLRWAVILLAMAGLVGLLLPALAHFVRVPEALASFPQAAVLPLVCLAALLAVLYGHGTSCPACGKWWARAEGPTECVGRETFESDGATWVRSKRQTRYTCNHCRQTWAVAFTDEFPWSEPKDPKRRPK